MLLDTDVLIDVALDRHPHADAAAELLDRLERGRENAFIAWHTVSNFYYLVAPTRGGPSARDFIVELTRFVEVAATDTRAVRFAAALPMRDFEDAMQVAAARLRCAAHRHAKRSDFDRSPIPASPRHSAQRNETRQRGLRTRCWVGVHFGAIEPLYPRLAAVWALATLVSRGAIRLHSADLQAQLQRPESLAETYPCSQETHDVEHALSELFRELWHAPWAERI